MKKKILMILHLPPPVHGAAMMGKYLIESKVINEAFDVEHINLSTSTKLEEVGRRGVKKIFSSFRLLVQVVRALLTCKYDLCYMTLTSSSTGFYKDLLIVFVLKLARQKIVYHFHNKGVSTRQGKWIDNMLYKYAFSGTRSILLSPSLYLDVQKYVKSENVFFCPNGIPSSSIENFIAINSTPGQPCKLLFLSHMMIQKGVVTLLDACKLLMDKNCCFECHFVGAWSNINTHDFNAMVKERGLDKIVFAHGPKFDIEKNRFFRNSDIFVLPTFYPSECFSLVLLEAMSFGLPIVSTFEGAIPDIVINKKTGFIVEKNNSLELADKLEILISKPELRTDFGRRGSERFQENFTIDKFEQNMAEILRVTLSSN